MCKSTNCYPLNPARTPPGRARPGRAHPAPRPRRHGLPGAEAQGPNRALGGTAPHLPDSCCDNPPACQGALGDQAGALGSRILAPRPQYSPSKCAQKDGGPENQFVPMGLSGRSRNGPAAKQSDRAGGGGPPSGATAGGLPKARGRGMGWAPTIVGRWKLCGATHFCPLITNIFQQVGVARWCHRKAAASRSVDDAQRPERRKRAPDGGSAPHEAPPARVVADHSR